MSTSTPPHTANRRTILVVEKDPRALADLERVLLRAGFEVVVATTGRDAVEIALRRAPDLVLLNAGLPDLNGVEVCGRIRAGRRESRVAVLVHGGFVRADERHVSGVTADDDQILPKRFGAEDLLPRIDGLLRVRDADGELTTSEGQFRAVFENATDAILIADDERRYVDANPAACELLGVTRDEIVNRPVDDVLAGDLVYLLDDVWTAFLGAGSFSGETRLRLKDGSELEVESYARANILPGRHLSILRDITQRKRAEAALARRLRQQALVTELGRRALAGEPLDRIFAEACRVATDALGCEFSALFELASDGALRMRAGCGWDDGYAEGYVLEPGRASQSAYTLETGESVLVEDYAAETRFMRSGLVAAHGARSGLTVIVPGKERPFGVLGAHAKLPGTFLAEDTMFLEGLANVLAEAIDRRAAEMALLRAEHRAVEEYERLLERLGQLAEAFGTARDLRSVYLGLTDFVSTWMPSSGVFISLYDPEREVRMPVFAWSEGSEMDVAGLPPMPMSGSPHSRAVATGRVIIEDDFEAAMSGKPIIHIGMDIDPRPVRSCIAAPMAVMGRVVGGIEVQSPQPAAFTSAHATALRMAANLAANAIENVRLFEREREREEQLRQSQKMEAVGRLAGGVAHDFNNILTVIAGYCDLSLRELDAEDPLAENITEVKLASERAAGLTRQLLAFSRKQVLQPTIVDLRVALVDIARMLERLIGEDIQLSIQPGENVPPVFVDRGQIEQVVINLAVNSRDAMPDGGTLRIETACVTLEELHSASGAEIPPGRYVMLSVSDSGTGIDEGTRQHIFEPFFTTKGAGKGTGLGLATVYGIVRQSGGFIDVETAPGAGTTFRIYLPPSDRESPEPLSVSRAGRIPKGTETVLLVEDEPALRRLAASALRDAGYTVIEASNGEEALRASERTPERIHLLLTDVIMPRMNGRRLADLIVAGRPGTRVLFMSGYTENAIAHHGVLDPNIRLLQKPFTAADLAWAVRDALDHAAAE